MKFQLSIASTYLPSWGLVECIREVMQNALDSQDKGNALDVRHTNERNGDAGTLRISNDGVKLDAKIWLMGTTTKNSDDRGGFGEGLKLGILAALRAGHKVKVINDDESWTPKLEESEAFAGAKVLTVYTHKLKSATGRFTVEIEGVEKEVWETIKERFLALTPPNDIEFTKYGQVIFDKKFAGKLFVKGIYIETDPRVTHGYNLNVKVDRDRRMCDRYEAELARNKIWDELSTREDAKLSARMMKLLEVGSKDIADTYGLGDEMKDNVVAAFVAEYGENAIAVTSMHESREVAHLGKRAVVVPSALAAIVQEKRGTLEKLKEEHAKMTKKLYGWDDLTGEEKGNWANAVNLVAVAAEQLGYKPVEARTSVVDFFDDKLEGLHDDGAIKIAKRILTDKDNLMATLVHEIAHDKGGDGEVEHERAEGILFSRIINNLLAERR